MEFVTFMEVMGFRCQKGDLNQGYMDGSEVCGFPAALFSQR